MARQPHATLILDRARIARLMSPADYLAAMESAFLALAEGRAVLPSPLHIAFAAGGFHAKGAGLTLADGRAFAAVKVNGNFPGNPARHGLPTIQGAIVLSDAADGRVLALMDSIEVTLRRTAAASVLAMRYLARADADRVGVIGCGAQAAAQLEAIVDARTVRQVAVHDRDRAAAESFAARVSAQFGLAVAPCRNAAEVARQCDLIVTCSTATAPVLEAGDIAPGTFVAAVGADAPHKHEIAPALMARAKVVVDSSEQCLAMGDLRHAIAAQAMRAEDVHADLAGLVAGRRPGRTSPDEIVIFDSTGLAVQDVAAAIAVYRRAASEPDSPAFALGRDPAAPA